MALEKRYRLDTAATAYPCTVDDLKRNLHIRTDDDDIDRDQLLQDLIYSAVEQSQNNTGRQYCQATFTLFLNEYPDGGVVEIEKGPVIEILSVKYYASGATSLTTVDPADYELDNYEDTARLRFKEEFTPDGDMLNPIQIQYTAGYSALGAQVSAVPKQLKDAVVLRASSSYLNPGNDPENYQGSVKIRRAEILEKDFKPQRF